MRNLLTRRWLGFFLAVIVLALAAVRLGDWQFNRLHERRAENRIIVTNLRAAPVPVAEVMRVGTSLSETEEWRRVTVTGTWDEKHSVVLKYQSRDSGAGVDVLTPLVTTSGAAVVVDRGWLKAQNNGQKRPRLPAATSGQVTVTGYTRTDSTGGSAKVSDLATRSVSSRQIAKIVPYDVYGGFVLMTNQAPRPATALGAPQLPEIDDGPHFFYGLQWWFFGFLAIAGFLFLAYEEFRQRRQEPATEDPEVAQPSQRV